MSDSPTMEGVTDFITSLQLTKKQLSLLKELVFLLVEKGAIKGERIWQEYQRRYTKNPKRAQLGVTSMKDYLEKINSVIEVNEKSELELTDEGKLYADVLLLEKRGTETAETDRPEAPDSVVKATESVASDVAPLPVGTSVDSSREPMDHVVRSSPTVDGTKPKVKVVHFDDVPSTRSSTNQIESYIQSLKLTENQLLLLVELTILIHSHGPIADDQLWNVFQREYSKTPNSSELSVVNMKQYLDKIQTVITKNKESKFHLTANGELYGKFLMKKILNGTMDEAEGTTEEPGVKEEPSIRSGPPVKETDMKPVWNLLPQNPLPQFAGSQMRGPVPFQFGAPQQPGQAALFMGRGRGRAAPFMRPGQAAPPMGPGQAAPPMRPPGFQFLGAPGQPVNSQGVPLLSSVPHGSWGSKPPGSWGNPFMGAPIGPWQLPTGAPVTMATREDGQSDRRIKNDEDSLRGFPNPLSPDTKHRISDITFGFFSPSGRDSATPPIVATPPRGESPVVNTPRESPAPQVEEVKRMVATMKLSPMQTTLLREVMQLLLEKGEIKEISFANEFEARYGKQPQASPKGGVKLKTFFNKINRIVTKDDNSKIHLTAKGRDYAESVFGKTPRSSNVQNRRVETVKPEVKKPEVKKHQVQEILSSMRLNDAESEILAELALLLHEKGAIEDNDISYRFEREYKKPLRVGKGTTLHEYLKKIGRIVGHDASSESIDLTDEGKSYVVSLIGAPKVEPSRASVWNQIPTVITNSNMRQDSPFGNVGIPSLIGQNVRPLSDFPPIGTANVPGAADGHQDGVRTKVKPKYHPMDTGITPPGGLSFLLEDVVLEGSDDPQNISRERLEAMAVKCIDIIAEQGEFVTPRRVEILLCQQLKIRDLGETKLRLRRGVEDLKPVHDLSRKIGQVDAHITASLALRNVNTLSDTLEGLREGIPDKRPYDSLRLGPITKNPVVQKLFSVPSGCDVIDISCIEVYSLLRDYIKKNDLWKTPIDTEKFMKHLMEEYGVEDVYTLGVKIRSIPLCMQNIKRAQRQEGETIRGYYSTVDEKCKSDLMSAYTSLRTRMLMEEDHGYTARAHYLTQDPADVIKDVMGKFKHFLQTARDLGLEDLNKDYRVAVQLEKELYKTKLVKDLFKFSVVVSNEDAVTTVRDFLEGLAGKREEAEMKTAKKEIIPRNEVVSRLLQYLDLCFKNSNTGLSLRILKEMEIKCAQYFRRDDFLDLGHESFLEFLLNDIRIEQVLEENGGVSLGGGSNKMASSLYRPSLLDIVELVQPIGEDKSEELVERLACHYYKTEKFSHLGLGPVKLVIDRLIGGKRRNVVNQTGLCHDSKIVLLDKNRFGIFGEKSVNETLKSLLECPLLEDLGSWTQWDLVFTQQHGPLKEFVEKNGGHGSFVLNGQEYENDLAALELEPGKLIRLTSDTDDDKFRDIVHDGNPRNVCGHLVSLIVMRGFKSAGMALLANVISAHLYKLCAVTPGAPPCGDSKNPAVDFVRDCLCFLPLMFCEKVADEAFIVPLSRVLGRSESKSLLSRSCTTFQQMNRLAVLGHFLGINQWQSLFQKPLVNPESGEEEEEDGGILVLGSEEGDADWPSEDDTSEADTDEQLSDDPESDVTAITTHTETTVVVPETTDTAVETLGNDGNQGNEVTGDDDITMETGKEDVVGASEKEEMVDEVADKNVGDVVGTTMETLNIDQSNDVIPDDDVTTERTSEIADDVTNEEEPEIVNDVTPDVNDTTEISDDVTLDVNVAAEETPKIADDVTLDVSVAAEETPEIADDVTLDVNVATEETPKTADDVTLDVDVATEKTETSHDAESVSITYDDAVLTDKCDVIPDAVLTDKSDVIPDTVLTDKSDVIPDAVLTDKSDVIPDAVLTDKSDVIPDAVLTDKSDVTTDKDVNTTTPNDDAIHEPIEEIDLDLDLSPQERKCKKVVETIRRDEFGIGVKLDDVARKLFQTQQAKLKRSLKRLSEDLYTKDTHFVLELVQNADDNSYDVTCPSMQFIIEKERITVLNNEVGFQENQTRALCDVGNSTKPKNQIGFIGQKGIGFKSVFRVTDRPEIHSNGFHFCFDMGDDEMGYILPHWIEEGQVASAKWQTRIVLPLKRDIKRNIHSLVNRFRDIHPSLLLFLHRLKSLTVENKISGTKSRMLRRDLGNKIIEIKHNKVVQRFLVVRQRLDVSKLEIKCKGDVIETEVALAFLVGTDTPQKQSVFAFLPLRDYGFRFVIQGDFDLPSSREDLDCDSAWNQWLRNEIAPTFVSALTSFRTIEEDPICAVKRFLMFVPKEDEIMDFFKPVARAIFIQLSSNEFIPNTENRPKLPSQLVAGADSFIRLTFTNHMLERYLNLSYIHPEIVTDQNRALLHDLGVKSLTNSDLLSMIEALSEDWGQESNSESTLVEIARILVCIQRSLDDLDVEDTTLESLKKINIIPDCQNQLVALSKRTVFFPFQQQGKHDVSRMLGNDLTIVDPRLLRILDNVANSQIRDVLEKLGVKQITVCDVIEHHILPTYRSEEWINKPRETLISYVKFLHEFQQDVFSVISFRDLSTIIQLSTNHGLKNPSRDAIHFTPNYGNSVDLKERFPGYRWCLLDDYPGKNKNSWRDFFIKLNVIDLFAVRRVRKEMSSIDLKETIWKDKMFREDLKLEIMDWESEELTSVINAVGSTSQVQTHQQMQFLFQLLANEWRNLAQFQHAEMTELSTRHRLHDVESTFANVIRSHPWVPGYKDNSDNNSRLVCTPDLYVAEDLYSPVGNAQMLLSFHVPYLDLKTKDYRNLSEFLLFLRIKSNVTLQDLKPFFLGWIARDEFTTTVEHLKHVYTFFKHNMIGSELEELFTQHKAIFVPEKPIVDKSMLVHGKFHGLENVCMNDPGNLFTKYKEEIESDGGSLKPILILDKYPQIYHEKPWGVRDLPTFKMYMDLLEFVCAYFPECSKKMDEVIQIYHQILTSPDQGHYQRDWLREFDKKRVIPTRRDVYVRLTDFPMLGDNDRLEKLFSDSENVHFLDLAPGKRAKRNRNKEDFQLQPLQNFFVKALKVLPLSDCYHEEIIPEGIQPFTTLKDYFHHVVGNLQKFIHHRHEHVYELLTQKNIVDFLKNLKFYSVGRLEAVYTMKYLKGAVKTESRKCIIQEKEGIVYVHKDAMQDNQSIQLEIAEFFSCGDESCADKLHVFLMTVHASVDDPRQNMTRGMKDYKLDKLPETEAIWEVEKAIVYRPPPPPPPPEPVVPLVPEPGKIAPGLRCWPPPAPGHGGSSKSNQTTGDKSTSEPVFPKPPKPDRVDGLPEHLQEKDDSQSKRKFHRAPEGGNQGSEFKVRQNAFPKLDGDESVPGAAGSGEAASDGGRGQRRDGQDTRSREGHGEGHARSGQGQSREGERGGQGQGQSKADVVDKPKKEASNIILGDFLPTKSDPVVPSNEGTPTKEGVVKIGPLPMTPSRDRPHGNVNKAPQTIRQFSPDKIDDIPDERVFYETGNRGDVTSFFEVRLDVASDQREIGRHGEDLVYKYLQARIGQHHNEDEAEIIRAVEWVNEDRETGLPFDIKLQTKIADEEKVRFIEVKSTMSETKMYFESSVNELLFANEQRELYDLYRVFSVGQKEKVKLIKLRNVAEALEKKSIRVFMVV